MIDQQQQLQLATVAEDRHLKERLRKLDGSAEDFESIEKSQVAKTDGAKKQAAKNITNKKWWYFW